MPSIIAQRKPMNASIAMIVLWSRPTLIPSMPKLQIQRKLFMIRLRKLSQFSSLLNSFQQQASSNSYWFRLSSHHFFNLQHPCHFPTQFSWPCPSLRWLCGHRWYWTWIRVAWKNRAYLRSQPFKLRYPFWLCCYVLLNSAGWFQNPIPNPCWYWVYPW